MNSVENDVRARRTTRFISVWILNLGTRSGHSIWILNLDASNQFELPFSDSHSDCLASCVAAPAIVICLVSFEHPHGPTARVAYFENNSNSNSNNYNIDPKT